MTGAVAEAVAARIMDRAGFGVFAQLVDIGARGADLLYLTPKDKVLVLEVKGTLRSGTTPRLRRSRLKQMSAAWLDEQHAPMLEWGLESGGVYGAVMVVDVASASARTAVTADCHRYLAVDELATMDELFAAAERESRS